MPEKVLIVDDDLDTVEMLTLALEEVGYKVKAATTGEEGLAAAKAFVPNLILLDLMLPDFNGYEFIDRLRSAAATAHLRVMVMTGLAGELPQVVAADEGAEGYIRKPFQVSMLLARVSAAMHAPGWHVHHWAEHRAAA